MSGWTPWRRDSRRLPGSLCDETPQPTPERTPGDRSRCATCAGPITWNTSHMWGDRWTHDGLTEAAADHEPSPAEAGKWQPRDDSEYDQAQPTGFVEFEGEFSEQEARFLRARFFAACQPTPVTAAVQEEIARLLLERDTETQRANEAEAKLAAAKARIRGLEDTVRAYATRDGNTLEQPRVRSLPAPGPLRIADDELLIQPYGTETAG